MGNKSFYISQREREAHLKAAKAAGFGSVEFVQEPDGTVRFFARVVDTINQSMSRNEWDEVLNGPSS